MDNITVIPMTNEALQAVTTPVVAFEQPFPERAGRIQRQLEDMLASISCVMLADTWPDALYNCIPYAVKTRAVSAVGKPFDRDSIAVWPETAMYKTNVAQLHEIDTRVLYRPHMHFFCRLRDQIRGHWDAECGLSPEPGIVVPDRGVYDTGLTHPAITMEPQSLRVTGILVIDHLTSVHPETLQSWQAQAEKSKELIIAICNVDPDSVGAILRMADTVVDARDCAPSDAVNAALRCARGEYITVLDPSAISLRERLTAQCDVGADVVALAPRHDYEPVLHSHSWLAGSPTSVEHTIMFHRRVFQLTGGMYPTLPVGFVYDKYLQAQAHHELSFAVLRTQLTGSIDHALPYGNAYSQGVYNDVFRRRQVHDRESNAWYLRRRR